MGKDGAIAVLRKNVARFDDAEMKESFRKWDKVVQYNFVDIDEHWHIKVTHGDAELREGAADGEPDVEYEMTTETCEQLSSGELSGMAAYASGAVKVRGAFSDMLKWKKVGNIR